MCPHALPRRFVSISWARQPSAYNRSYTVPGRMCRCWGAFLFGGMSSIVCIVGKLVLSTIDDCNKLQRSIRVEPGES
jgi:hypothetical protein